MSQPPFSRVSLRYSVPVMVVVAFMVMTLISAWFDMRLLERRLIQNAEVHSIESAARIARLAARDLADYPANVEQDVMLQAVQIHSGLRVIAVLSPQGQVLFAQRADWANRPAAEVVQNWSASQFALAMKGSVPVTSWDQAQRRRSVWMPFDYPRAANELVSSQHGVIYLVDDISDALIEGSVDQGIVVLRNLAVAGLLALMLSYGLHRRLTVPLEQLHQATRRIAQGDLNVSLTGIGAGEIGELAQALQEMEGKLHASQKALEQQRGFLKTLLTVLPDLIWLKDPKGIYIFCNHRFEELYGHTEAEIVGRSDYHFTTPEQAEFFRQHDLLAIQAGKSCMNEEELVFASDGHIETVETIKTPMYGEAGELIGVLGIGRNISDRMRDTQAARKSESTLHAILSATADGLLAIGSTGQVLLANPQFTKMWQIPQALLDAQDDRLLLNHVLEQLLDPAAFLAEVERLYATDDTSFDTLNFKDGRVFERYSCPLLQEGVRTGRVWSFRDVTKHRRAEAALRESESRFQAIFDGAIDGILVADADTKQILMSNRTVRNMLGFSHQELQGMKVEDLHPSADLPRVLEVFERRRRGESVPLAELPVQRKDGSVFIAQIEAAQLEMDGCHCSVGFFRDITERHVAQEALQRLAYIDPLTGLPNRVRLLEVLDQALQDTKKFKRYGALIKLNVDRFRNINDAAGHTLGDVLLAALAERVAGLLHESDVLVRLIGDAFGILLSSTGSSRQEALQRAQLLANMLHVALSEPFWLNNESIKVTVSMGMAVFPENVQEDATDVLRKSMLALHRAKQAGGDQTVVYEGRLDEVAKQRFQLEHELRSGISAGELRLLLQPQVNAAGRTVGAEALVRWQHPQRGTVLPMSFIPIAEETDLIIDLDEWVMMEVCRVLTHPSLASRSMRIAVNVSPRHFRRANFVAWLKELLASSGVDPTHLTLEVTEGLMIENVSDVIAKMAELTALGIHFSVDDFGTGYSSLAYLRRLPLHELKIDKTFVQDAPSNPEGAALVEAILAVAKHMHLKVVAEGVETAEQAEFLNSRAVVVHQGYLFGKPDLAEHFLKRLAAEDGGGQ